MCRHGETIATGSGPAGGSDGTVVVGRLLLRQIDDAGVRFVVPLRASAGFRERFLADVGHQGLILAGQPRDFADR